MPSADGVIRRLWAYPPPTLRGAASPRRPTGPRMSPPTDPDTGSRTGPGTGSRTGPDTGSRTGPGTGPGTGPDFNSCGAAGR
jgi:hypothetical protein